MQLLFALLRKMETYKPFSYFCIDANSVYARSLKTGSTPLHLAAKNGHLEIVDQLLDYGGDVNSAYSSSREKGCTPLHLAVENGNEAMTELLLRRGAQAHCAYVDGTTALHIAAEHGHSQIGKHLLNFGADVDSQCINMGNNRLDTPLRITVAKGNEKFAKLLLSGGASANYSYDSDETSLHIAAEKGYLKIAEHLLKNGADVNSQCITFCENSYTPLMVAVDQGNDKMTKLLLIKGAYADSCYDSGETPLYIAAENGCLEIAEQLLNHGADVNYAYIRLHEDGYYTYTYTSLHAAIEGGNEEITKLLLGRGAKIDCKDKCYGTLFHVAAMHGHSQITRQLLNHGLDVNSKVSSYKKNCTPLYIAAKNSHDEVVKILLLLQKLQSY